MSLFRKKREPDDDEKVVLVSVPVTQLMRQLIYDLGLGSHLGVIAGAGLTPVSDEVDEMERRASDTRLTEVQAMQPIISRYAEMAAGVIFAATVADKDQDEIDPIQAAASHAVFATVANASITGFLSSFFDLGLLHGHFAGSDVESNE